MSTKYWSNVQCAVQTALASAITITAISKANPGVVTYTGTDPSNGDIVLLEVVGMREVTLRPFRVANVNAGSNTFELEGEDTTLYNTFTSGTFKVVTLGASLGEIRTINTSGGDLEYADDSVVNDNVRRRTPVLASPQGFSFDYTHDPSDAGYLEMRKAYKTLTGRVVKFTFANGNIFLFYGKGGAPGNLGGAAFQAVTTRIALEAQGTPTEYTS